VIRWYLKQTCGNFRRRALFQDLMLLELHTKKRQDTECKLSVQQRRSISSKMRAEEGEEGMTNDKYMGLRPCCLALPLFLINCVLLPYPLPFV